MTREEQAALVAWLRRPGVVWSAVTEQLEECGSVQKAAAGQAPAQGSLFEVASADGLDEAARDLERWERAGIRMVCVLDAEYPSNLRMVHQHPPVLFMRGTADERDATSVAIVGTRQPTPRGIDQARQLATGLAAHGVPVISGLAAGIDTAALTAALTAGGRAVAVIGTGIDRVYPPQNAGLQEEIAANGLLISQFLPGSPPTKASFPMRNAVMSGYALATVVVEAADRSGSRMQARLALQHGRHVFLMRSLLEHEWARDYAERPGCHRRGSRRRRVRRPATARVGADGSRLGLTAYGFGLRAQRAVPQPSRLCPPARPRRLCRLLAGGRSRIPALLLVPYRPGCVRQATRRGRRADRPGGEAPAARARALALQVRRGRTGAAETGDPARGRAVALSRAA